MRLFLDPPRLHDELIAFTDWISPTPLEHETRQLVVQLIRRAIVREWADAKVEAFGSQSTQLYMPQGDIDLVVVSDVMEAQRKENVLRKMAAILRRNNLATDVQVIARAKVPIVKFVCTLGKLRVDISVNQTNGIEACDLVRDWLERCPPIRPLIMATKLLLSQRGLSEVFSGGLGSYSVICLVISHLQMHPKVQRGEVDPSLNLGVLFLDFLELYGKNFGYDNVGVSIQGRGSYFTKVSRGWRDDRRPFMLSIEDPLDASNDISKGSFSILSIRQALGGAYDILTAALSQRANDMAKKRASDHWIDEDRQGKRADEDEEARAAILNGVRNPVDPDKDPRSLLGALLGINRETLKARRELAQLWRSGSLQTRLGRPPPGSTPEPLSVPGPSTTQHSEKSDGKGGKKKGKRGQTSPEGSHSTVHKTSQGASIQIRGTAGEPVIVEDDSSVHGSRAFDESEDDESVMLDEEELATSQGVQFSSATSQSIDRGDESSIEGVAVWGDSKDDLDSRYAEQSKKRKLNGQRGGRGGGRSRIDIFSDGGRKTFVDDDSASDLSGEEAGEDTQSAPKNGQKADTIGRTSRSSSSEERRKRKNEYWASKGNAVGTGTLSPDEMAKEGHDEEGDEGGDGVVLNIYD